jgi:hypothetical protein
MAAKKPASDKGRQKRGAPKKTAEDNLKWRLSCLSLLHQKINHATSMNINRYIMHIILMDKNMIRFYAYFCRTFQIAMISHEKSLGLIFTKNRICHIVL